MRNVVGLSLVQVKHVGVDADDTELFPPRSSLAAIRVILRRPLLQDSKHGPMWQGMAAKTDPDLETWRPQTLDICSSERLFVVVIPFMKRIERGDAPM